MGKRIRAALLVAALLCIAGPAFADMVTDWDEKAVPLVAKFGPPAGQRVLSIMHASMFDAVNSIEKRYRPYKFALPAASGTSPEAAAVAAATFVLAKAVPEAAADIQGARAASLAAIPDGEAKNNGVQLGEAIAAKMLEARANDGADKPDAYRPKTKPGAYIPTPITAAFQYASVTPFTMTKPSQFRPKAPISLQSRQWTRDYLEIKEYGEKNSAKRSAKQTEDARFWLLTGAPSYHPVARQIIAARRMALVDSARAMALVTMAAADAYIAVFDAKYHYEFWRPITAIRNGDIDGNDATPREPTWQPIDATPMHPEYPCAHCITSSAVATVLETLLGTADLPEFSSTSSTAPGVTHRWTNLWVYANEVAEARIWAGFHYRFSTVVGQDMGRKIGAQAVRTMMPPAS